MSMDFLNSQKETAEPSGLRLVHETREPQKFPTIEKQFVNFMCLRISPEWRKLNAETKRIFKSEFQSTYDAFNEDFLLFSYSLVGFDSKADLMFWRIGSSLDRIQEMTAKLYRTNLGNYLETADNYLSVTKKMMFVNGGGEDRFHVAAGEKKYHFLYIKLIFLSAQHLEWFFYIDSYYRVNNIIKTTPSCHKDTFKFDAFQNGVNFSYFCGIFACKN